MPVRDIYHYTVKNALLKDEWRITHDPLRLELGKKDLYVDPRTEEILKWIP